MGPLFVVREIVVVCHMETIVRATMSPPSRQIVVGSSCKGFTIGDKNVE
jgi:hypothetical protein